MNARALFRCALALAWFALCGEASAQAARVVEFYNTALDHYFITASVAEAAAIDAGGSGPGWARTGQFFDTAGPASVCRFYGSIAPGPNSHFYTASEPECASLVDLAARTPATQKRWNYEGRDFATTVPAGGTCPPSTLPVLRAYNDGAARGIDSNHRIAASPGSMAVMASRGWAVEGTVMCALAPPTLDSYADKVIALWTGGYPFAVSRTGVARVEDLTRLAGTSAAPTACWLADQPLASGWLLASCRPGASSPSRQVYAIDPVRSILVDWGDQSPEGVLWLDIATYDPTRPEWDAKAQVNGGWFFTPTGAGWNLMFAADPGGSVSVVKAGSRDLDGPVTLMVAYRH